MILCRKCGVERADDEFYRLASGKIQRPCKDCKRAASRALYAEDPERHKAQMREWAANNPEKVKVLQRKAYDRNREDRITMAIARKKANPEDTKDRALRRTYGITLKQYNAMLEAQNYQCGICATKHVEGSRSSVLHVDHCHNTGVVRSLLCSNCNKGLGCFKDDPELLRKAMNYLGG